MADPLTANALNALQAAIHQRYAAFVPSQHARSDRTPVLQTCRIVTQYQPRQYVGIVYVEVLEFQRIPRYAPIRRPSNFSYCIRRDGTITTQFPIEAYRDYSVAYEFYKQPLLQFLRDSTFDCYAKPRIQARTRTIHEELAAKVWHPDRVAALLDKGGWDLVDALA